MKRAKSSLRYSEMLQTVSDNEEKLCSLLDGKEKSLFLDLVNAQDGILATSEIERFIQGFQFGAKLMLDTFVITKSDFLED